jgi:6-phosphogluconolactonase (cycloisomerase 2 family)
MARAVTLGTRVRGGTAAVHGLVVVACVGLAACAGGGKDRSFELPPGSEFDGARAGKVIAVVEAQNLCGSDGSCVTPPAGPCHLGEGNTRGLSIYRLGATGLLFGNSATGAEPEQRIALDDNPRRVVANPRIPTILYVSTEERVQVVRLQAGGGSACIDETSREQDVRPDAEDMDPVDMVVDPSIGNGILYVATRGSNRIDAYPLAEDGTLDSLPTSCIVGGGGAEFVALAPLGEGFFAAGGTSQIEIHARVQGQFLPEPDPNATKTPTPAPTASPTPAPGETPGPTTPSPERSTCFDARLVTTPLSTIGSALVTQVLFEPSASAPLGQLFISEEVSQRIFTFPVNADGVIANNDSSSTKRAGVYQRMLRHRHVGQDILYSSVYNEGRVDVFRMENGLLPDESFSRTAEDPNALPVGLIIDEPNGTILYVTEAGLDRVDGFRIRPDGGLEDEPATSTAPPVDAEGRSISTFPDDLVIVPLP